MITKEDRDVCLEWIVFFKEVAPLLLHTATGHYRPFEVYLFVLYCSLTEVNKKVFVYSELGGKKLGIYAICVSWLQKDCARGSLKEAN